MQHFDPITTIEELNLKLGALLWQTDDGNLSREESFIQAYKERRKSFG